MPRFSQRSLRRAPHQKLLADFERISREVLRRAVAEDGSNRVTTIYPGKVAVIVFRGDPTPEEMFGASWKEDYSTTTCTGCAAPGDASGSSPSGAGTSARTST